MTSTVILSDNGVSSGSAGLKSQGGNDGVLLLQTTTSGGTATTAVTLDNNQNMGLGVTPSANTLSKGFDLVGGAGVFGYGNNAYWSTNAYYDSAWKYKATAAAAFLGMESGSFRFNIATSGTAGAAITFTEAMRLDASGNLLVGATASPSNNATLYSQNRTGTNAIVLKDTVSNNLLQGLNSSNTSVIFIAANGNITNSNNSYGAISDIKLKENITDATPKLAGLMQVRVVNYNLKSDPDHKQLGVIAQELEQVFPSMIDESPDFEQVTTTDENGNETTEQVATNTTTKSVKYSVFVPMLIKSIQEQQALITQLQADVAALKGQA